MGVSGTMELTNASVAPDIVVDIGEPTGDVYIYNIDLSSGSTFVLSGDFEFTTGNDDTYVSAVSLNFPGSLIFSPSDGTFTYEVSLTDVQAAGVNSGSIQVIGSSDVGDNDTDTIEFNYTICFAEGTGIATPEGETAVEALQIGDLVRTADGRDVPVKWVGQVTAKPMFNPADRLEPVKIAAGAFGDTPHTDLIVTADHGMVLDGTIINASALVNGTTVTWLDWKQLGQTFTYYHVETDAHDVILAHGAASETFIDAPDRQSFDNYDDFAARYGDGSPVPSNGYPRVSCARLVPQSVKHMLKAAKRA